MKQHRLMEAVKHGWHKPGGGGPSVAVATEFANADEAKGKFEGVKGKDTTGSHRSTRRAVC